MAKGRLLLLVNLHASRAAACLGPAVAVLAARGFDLDIRQSADRAAMARTAASFISSLMTVAPTSMAPRKMKGKHRTLLTWLG